MKNSQKDKKSKDTPYRHRNDFADVIQGLPEERWLCKRCPVPFPHKKEKRL